MNSPSKKASTGAGPAGPKAAPAACTSPPQPLEPGAKIQRYLYMALAWWWLITLFALTGTSIAVAWCMITDPVYRATCTYELAREPKVTHGDSAKNKNLPRINQNLDRQVYFLQSDIISSKVKDQLKPFWQDKLDHFSSPSIRIERSRNVDNIVIIEVDSPHKEYAMAFLRKMLEVFKAYQRKHLTKIKESSVHKLRRERQHLLEELKYARTKVRDFEVKHNIHFTQTKARYDEAFLASLVQRKNAIRMERTMIKAQFPFLKNADANTVNSLLALNLETHDLTVGAGRDIKGKATAKNDTKSPELTSTSIRGSWSKKASWRAKQTKLQNLKNEYQNKLEVYKPAHPEMTKLHREIENAESELRLSAEDNLQYLQNRCEALKIQEKSLDKATENWRRTLNLSFENQAKYKQLKATVKHYEELHDNVYSYILENSLIDASAYLSRPLEAPHLLRAPVAPQKLIIIGLALFLSLATGGGTVLVLDQLPSKALDVQAVETQLHIPYLCGIPNWEHVDNDFKKRTGRIVAARDESDIKTEVYRSLRDSIQYAVDGSETYTMMVSSSLRQTGKSITILNLAIVSAWTGQRVLLIDGDMRRGFLQKELGLKCKQGLAELIRGTTHDWQAVVQQTEHENLDFIATGKFSPDLPDLLSLHQLRRLIASFRTEYDLVLLDSAPLNLVVEPAIMARACDATLLLINHEKSYYNDVRHAVHRLGNTKILGFCLNSITVPQTRYDQYKYRYHYYGHYYHPYASTKNSNYKQPDTAASPA